MPLPAPRNPPPGSSSITHASIRLLYTRWCCGQVGVAVDWKETDTIWEWTYDYGGPKEENCPLWCTSERKLVYIFHSSAVDFGPLCTQNRAFFLPPLGRIKFLLPLMYVVTAKLLHILLRKFYNFEGSVASISFAASENEKMKNNP